MLETSSGRVSHLQNEKANSLNFYYSSVFSSEDNIPNIEDKTSSETFTIDTKIIRKRIAAIGKNKSVGPDGVSGEILKLGGEAMIPYLLRLLDITMNNGTLPGVKGSRPGRFWGCRIAVG